MFHGEIAVQTLPLLVFLCCPSAAEHAVGGAAKSEPVVQLLRADGHVLTVKWDSDEVRQRHRSNSPLVLPDIPISVTRWVDLELTPFSVAGSNTRFVLGRKDVPDEPFAFDTSRVQAFRGRIKGEAASDVFIVFGDVQTTGYIDLGPGQDRILISSKDKNGAPLSRAMTSVFPAGSALSFQPPVPLCGVETAMGPPETNPLTNSANPHSALPPAPGIRLVELAVDTDYEYFALFGDRDAATEYLVQMYTQVSHIFLRDAKAHFELVLVRLWDDPTFRNDRANDGSDLWGGPVPFDVLQFASGSRSSPYGGIASFGICGHSSSIWYVQGFFSDPKTPSPYQYDIFVAAHELGHNAGAPHTHDVGIDNCDNPHATPQRGTIMSYCQQTYSGLNANQDLYLHQGSVASMYYLRNGGCVVDDCNLNRRDDALDILDGSSVDVNGDGVPDECTDCNGNHVLDDQDISAGTSADLNANSVPDECEPDCNGNEVPDLMDISGGTSADLYGNAVPDECETDCNDNNMSDYTEIQLNMPRDVDRNAILDECQDCDIDGTTDHAALQGAHNLWIVSGMPAAPLREFFATTGVLVRAGQPMSMVSEGQDVVIAPDGRILVSSGGTNRIQAYDRQANFINDLVPPGSLGMDFPTGMVILPDGRLLVASRNTHNILSFDALTGAPLGVFVVAGSGGLTSPHGMTIGPQKHFFVTSDSNEIIEYSGQDGSFIRVFISASANGGLLKPRDLTFKPDGNLLVTSYGTNKVLEYDGQSGAAMGSWAVLGFAVSGMTPVKPWEIEIGPNGNVFVSRAQSDNDHDENMDGTALHFSNAQVFEYDVCNGNFVRVHIGGNDHGLDLPTGFAFMPGWEVDCNFNQLPDTCDTASGHSLDHNGNYVPDECEVDCNVNGRLDRLDIIPFGLSRDCNRNLTPDECDVAMGLSTDCDGSGVPDECEPDCNGIMPIDSCGFDRGSAADCDGNGIADSCEIFQTTAADCNANCVPDPCDPNFDGDTFIDDCDTDIDNDGIINGNDACDFTPHGIPVNSQGRAIGDITGDCAITLRDFKPLVGSTPNSACLLGPGSSPTAACIGAYDYDIDGDVDMIDLSGFQNAFGRQ